MKLYNRKYNSNPIILHRPGRNWHNESCFCSNNCKFWHQLNKSFFSKKYKFNNEYKNVTLVTWSNREEKQILEKCCDHLKINYVVLGKDIKVWVNTFKILTLENYISEIKTKYTFGLDSFDVFFLGNVEMALSKFDRLNCEMLFNSSPKKFPEDSDGSIEEMVAPKDTSFIYLNAGCWLAKTSFLKEILPKLKNFIKEEPKQISEQYFMRKNFATYFNQIKIDYYMDIFQSGCFDQVSFDKRIL